MRNGAYEAGFVEFNTSKKKLSERLGEGNRGKDIRKGEEKT